MTAQDRCQVLTVILMIIASKLSGAVHRQYYYHPHYNYYVLPLSMLLLVHVHSPTARRDVLPFSLLLLVYVHSPTTFNIKYVTSLVQSTWTQTKVTWRSPKVNKLNWTVGEPFVLYAEETNRHTRAAAAALYLHLIELNTDDSIELNCRFHFVTKRFISCEFRVNVL